MKFAVWIIAIVLVFGVGFGAGFLFQRGDHTAYVDTAKLYNDFEMKKELEQKVTEVQLSRKAQLDSLKINFVALSKKTNPTLEDRTKLQALESQYHQMQQQFEADNGKIVQYYTNQIWTQLNQYIRDYGKQEGYTYIYGGDGSGTIMYAQEKRNITPEVVAYVNARYKGKGK